MRSTTLLFLAAGLGTSGFQGVRAAANLCYFPGGIQSLDVPCDPKAEVSMCCGSVNACLSNGLCKLDDTSNTTGISYARGTCSDPTWQSPICPQNCILNPDTRKNSSAFDFRFNGVQVWQCDSQGFGVPGKFCCESAAEKTRCCSTPAAVFGPLIAATPGNAAAVQTFNSGAPSIPTPSGSGSYRSGDPTEAPSGQQTPAQTSAPTMTSKIPASTPAEAGKTAGGGTQEKQGLSMAAMVSVGVGASVGGALLVAVGVMWWMRKERRKRGHVALDCSSADGGDLSRANSGRIAYEAMNVGNGTGTISSMGTGTYGGATMGTISSMGTGTYGGATMGTISSMGTGTYGGTTMNDVGMGMGRTASGDWDGSPAELGGAYQMAEIDGREKLVVSESKERRKSLHELP